MRQTKGKAHLILFFSLLWISSMAPVFGQQTQVYQVTEYIQLIQSKFDVRISFSTQDLQKIKFEVAEPISLSDAITFINSDKTSLQIQQISDRYFSISLKEKANDLICIQLIDAAGEPISDASIKVIDKDQEFAVVSNSQGKAFVPIRYEGLEATTGFLGYAASTFVLNAASSCATYQLYKTVNQLDVVLLERIFTQGIYRGKDGSFKFTTDDFGLLPGVVEADVLQMTQVLPGVESIDETVSNINIRGGINSENLILWDGIRMYQSGHFFGLISAFNPYITKNVSVYKNGTKSRFGESVSGVIDMQSEDEVANSFHGRGTLSLLHANAFANIPITSNFSVLIAGRRSLNDLFQTPIYSSYSERVFQNTEITNILTSDTQSSIRSDEDFTFYDVSAKALWDFSKKDKIRLNVLLIDNALRFTESISTASFEITETSNLEQESMAGGIYWSHDWSDNTKTMVQGYTSLYKLDSRNLDLFTARDDIQRNELLENGLTINVETKLSDKVIIESGYKLTETGVTNEEITNIPEFRRFKKDVLLSHSLFSQMSLSGFSNNTLFTGGLRFIRYPKLKVYRAEPRMSVHQKLGGGFALEFLAELRSQSITQNVSLNSDFLGVENSRWAIADGEQIPLITSRQSSFGVLYTKNNWLLNAELFVKKVKGITTESQGFQNQFEFASENGNYLVRGLELVVNKQWNRFGGWLSYTYMKNDYEFATLDTPEFPNNIDIRHAFKGALSYQLNKLSLVLGIHWRSGKPFTEPINPDAVLTSNDESINYGPPNAQNVPSFIRTDFSVKYVLIDRKGLELRLNGAIQNVFNQENILNLYYRSRINQDGELTINKIENKSLRFTPNLSVEVLF